MYIVFYLSFLTIFSSIPYSLLTYTLQNWQFDQQVSITQVALFTFTQIPYFLNPFWGYLIDKFYHILTERFYFLVSISVIMLACLGLSMTQPQQIMFWFWAMVMCFGASWFDAALGAYRTYFSQNNLASMAASLNVSYRVGMILFQAGLVLLSNFVSWQSIYVFLSLLCLVWFFGVIIGHFVVIRVSAIKGNVAFVLKSWLYDDIGFSGLGCLFLFHASYYWMAAILLGYFRMILGIQAVEVAAAMKFFGVGITVIMSFIAGYWLKQYRFKYMGYLFVIQCASFLLMFFLMMGQLPAHMTMVLLIGVENFTHGFFATIAVALVLHCANQQYPATTMAILTCVCLASRLVVASFSGWFFEYSVHGFWFILAVLAILPIIFIYRSPLMYRLHLQG